MADSSPSVVIVRLDAIGDALALTPLIAALRAHGLRVGVVLRQVNAGVFAQRAVDRVHVADFALRSNSRQTRAGITRAAREIAAERYTHALVATEDPGGYRLAHASGIPVRIGFENGLGKPFKTLWVRSLCTQTQRRSAGLDARAPHECEVLFELGRSLLGTDDAPTRDTASLRPLILDDEPVPDERVLLQITDKWERLGATLGDLLEVARRVARRHAIRLVAASSEEPFVRRFEASSEHTVERFATLAPWKAAIASARAVVAPDSGALHVAGMVGTPTVALFAPNPQYGLQAARWAPWAAPHHLVQMDEQWPLVAADALDGLLSDRQSIRT